MKISNDEAIRAGSSVDPVAAVNPHLRLPAEPAKIPPPGSGPAAHVELSARAKALSAAKTEAASYLPAVHAAPDVRTDLVAKLKAQVESGSYHVSSSDIADQIVRRGQADKLQ